MATGETGSDDVGADTARTEDRSGPHPTSGRRVARGPQDLRRRADAFGPGRHRTTRGLVRQLRLALVRASRRGDGSPS